MTPLLELLNDPPEQRLSQLTVLYRVQRIDVRHDTVLIGPLKLPPVGPPPMPPFNRFDVMGVNVGYFADSAITAVYETLVRRETVSLSLSGTVAKRELLAVQTSAPLRLVDLRGSAHDWPVLQSLRYDTTQELATGAVKLGFDGMVYKSAQRFDADCYVLFGQVALASVQAVDLVTLTEPTLGTPHRAVVDAIRGSGLALTP